MYNGNFGLALEHLFPEIGLDESKFLSFTRYSIFLSIYNYRKTSLAPLLTIIGHHYGGVKRRRRWFVDFAHENKFDPFSSEAWYDLQLHHIVPLVRNTRKSREEVIN